MERLCFHALHFREQTVTSVYGFCAFGSRLNLESAIATKKTGGFGVTPIAASILAIVCGAEAAMETLGIIEAAKQAPQRLRSVGLSRDKRVIARTADATSKELDVACAGAPLRRRQASWKQSPAARWLNTHPSWEEARLPCGSRRATGQSASPWTTWSLASMSGCGCTCLLSSKELCQHQQRPKADCIPGAKFLAHLDEREQHALQRLMGGDRAQLHQRSPRRN